MELLPSPDSGNGETRAIRRINMEVSVVIPNYNGIAFLDSVLASLEGQTLQNFEVIFVDNGSSDGSCSFVSGNYPWVHIIELAENYGFCRAVNEGIKTKSKNWLRHLNQNSYFNK